MCLKRSSSFTLNLLIASLMLTFMWWYVIHHFAELNPGGQNPGGRGREKAYVIPAVTLLAIGVAFINPGQSMWCYILIPVIIFILKHRQLKETMT